MDPADGCSGLHLESGGVKCFHRLVGRNVSGGRSGSRHLEFDRMGSHRVVDDAVLGVPVRIYNACVSNTSRGIMSRARWCVASKSTGQPMPAFTANNQVRAQTHQESPAFNPGKLNRGAGVMRSLPMSFAN